MVCSAELNTHVAEVTCGVILWKQEQAILRQVLVSSLYNIASKLYPLNMTDKRLKMEGSSFQAQ